MKPRTFKAPKGVESFKTITIREVDGEDELAVADRLKVFKSRFGKEGNGVAELVRISITHVNGKPVGAFDEFDDWPYRDRMVATRFHMVLNSVEDDDLGKAIAEAVIEETTETKTETSTPPPNGG